MATEVKQPVKKVKVWKGEKRSGPAPARHIPWPEVRLLFPCYINAPLQLIMLCKKITSLM